MAVGLAENKKKKSCGALPMKEAKPKLLKYEEYPEYIVNGYGKLERFEDYCKRLHITKDDSPELISLCLTAFS